MARPTVTPTAEEAYAAMGAWAAEDARLDYPLLRFIAATADLLDPIEALVRDRDDQPGWAIVFDPDTAPLEFLDWMGQFLGVTPVLGLPAEARRLRIRETAGFQRGTRASIEGAARQYLTGNRQVLVYEREGSPYRLTVRTYETETPNAPAVRAALMAAKPAGLVLTYEVASGGTYAELATAYPTYPGLDAAFANYREQTLWLPSGGGGASSGTGTFKVRI